MCFALIKNLLDYVYSKSGCLLEKIAEKFSEFYHQKFSPVLILSIAAFIFVLLIIAYIILIKIIK